MNKYQRRILKAVMFLQCTPSKRENPHVEPSFVDEKEIYMHLKISNKSANSYARALRECIALEFLYARDNTFDKGVIITSRGIEALERWKHNLLDILKTIAIAAVTAVITALISTLWN